MSIFKVTAKNREECLVSFREIAYELCNKYELLVKDEPYRIFEVEFYYHDKGIHHPDKYVHGDVTQHLNSVWYFHIKKVSSSRRKGIDIAIGDQDRGAYGGILIRGIQNINDKSIIQGPCRVADKLLKLIREIPQILDGKSVFSEPMQLRKRHLDFKEIHQGPRVLYKSRDDSSYNFFDAPYRFAHNPRESSVTIEDSLKRRMKYWAL